MKHWRLLAGVLLFGAPGCTAPASTQAAVATAVTVAATAVNRKITNECWAACTPGYVCEHESGLCVKGECQPHCRDEQLCSKVSGQLMCIDKGMVYKANIQGKGSAIPVGGPPTPLPGDGGQHMGTPSKMPGALVQQACTQPGSAAWYAEARAAHEEATTQAEEHTGRRSDFVGVWSVAAAVEQPPEEAPRPLIVAPSWYGHSKDRALSYQVKTEGADVLVLLTAPANAPEQEVRVEFVDADHFRLRGVDYVRQDCTIETHAGACCELPRGRWVRLRAERVSTSP